MAPNTCPALATLTLTGRQIFEGSHASIVRLPRLTGKTKLLESGQATKRNWFAIQKVTTGTNKYLYIFGYQTPEQLAGAAKDEHAEEASEALFIEAQSAERALAWGREISEEYVHRLFEGQAVDWKSMHFAHWVENEPQTEYPIDILASLPVVSDGQYPDFQAFKR